VLFEDHYSETGRLFVYDTNPGLLVQLAGSLKTDDPVAMGRLLASGDLEHVYLALHPEASVAPAVLSDIDRQWAASVASARDATAKDATTTPVEPVPHSATNEVPGLTTQNVLQFNNTACQTFSDGRTQWIPDLCVFSGTPRVFQKCREADCPPQWVQAAGDRAYVWNQTNSSAEIFTDLWYPQLNPPALEGASWGTIPAQWWSWMSWSNTWGSAHMNVDLLGHQDATGDGTGVTHHQPVAVVK
jgi:hypothetical protein